MLFGLIAADLLGVIRLKLTLLADTVANLLVSLGSSGEASLLTQNVSFGTLIGIRRGLEGPLWFTFRNCR